MEDVAIRTSVLVTMPIGNNLLGWDTNTSLPICNHLMGLLLVSLLHLLAQAQSKTRPWSGYWIVSIEHQAGFLLPSNAGDSRTETPRLGYTTNQGPAPPVTASSPL